MTEFDGAEGGPVPLPLLAVTANVYAVPAVRAFTVAHVSVPLAVAVNPPGDDVTVYLMIERPPFLFFSQGTAGNGGSKQSDCKELHADKRLEKSVGKLT